MTYQVGDCVSVYDPELERFFRGVVRYVDEQGIYIEGPMIDSRCVAFSISAGRVDELVHGVPGVVL